METMMQGRFFEVFGLPVLAPEALSTLAEEIAEELV
jgi:hypothetical protein